MPETIVIQIDGDASTEIVQSASDYVIEIEATPATIEQQTVILATGPKGDTGATGATGPAGADGDVFHAADAVTTAADADEMGIWQTTASALRKITWANVKATLAGMFAKIDQTTPQTLLGTWAFPSVEVSDTLKMGNAPTVPNTPDLGEVFWNDAEQCLSYGVDGGTMEIGQEMVLNGVNLEDASMVDGDIVSVSAISGNRLGFRLTDATNSTSARACIGMVTNGGAKNATVRVTTFGLVHKINTQGLAEGVACYVDPSNRGKIIQTMPQAPNYTIALGVVMVAHQNQGVFACRVLWIPSLLDLSDVDGTPLTASGQILVWDQTRKVFDFTDNISNYLLSSTAASTYQTQAAMSAYLQSATASTTYLKLDQTTPQTTVGTFTFPSVAIQTPSNATALKLQTFPGQTAAGAQIGDIAGGAMFQVFPLGNVSSTGGNTSGITDWLVNPATKTSGNLLDLQVGGASKIRGSSAGSLTLAGSLSFLGAIVNSSATAGISIFPWNTVNCGAGSTGLVAIALGNNTQANIRTGGDNIWCQINSVWNQATGTATNTTQELNITNTAVGSGEQLARRTKVNGVVVTKEDILGNYVILSDTAGLKLGAGVDMMLSYDGTIGKIDASLVAPSDLHITTGASKTLVLDTPVYRDLYTAVLNLRAGATPPAFAAFQNGVYGYRFDAGVADEVHGAIELQHDYKEGTAIEVHCHWSPTTTNTGSVVFGFEYTVANMGTGTFVTTATLTNTPQASSGTVNKHDYSHIGTISGTGRKIGDIVAFRFYRQNGGTDTFTGNCFVHQVGLHYECDTMGSRSETAK